MCKTETKFSKAIDNKQYTNNRDHRAIGVAIDLLHELSCIALCWSCDDVLVLSACSALVRRCY